jgi:glycine dehydrogenase subunit 2
MIEPTETESRATLDEFVAAMKRIYAEAEKEPETVKQAPHSLRLRRIDEAQAARHPILRWTSRGSG